MAVREYIGARYVPIFGRKGDDTIEWSSTKNYEPLTIVMHMGNSYTSRQAVPVGIPITNTDYWVQTGNYSAQIEQYRQEVLGFSDRIDTMEETIEQIEDFPGMLEDETNARISADNTLNDKIDDEIKKINKSALQSSTVITIGDSYAKGDYGSGWAYYFSQYGDPKNFLNVSTNGGGFSVESTSNNITELQGVKFIANVNYAATHLPNNITPEEVDYVIFGGGYNDKGTETAQVKSDMLACFSRAKTLFPNAEIHYYPLCVGNLFWRSSTTSEQRALWSQKFREFCTYAAEAGVSVCFDSYMWLIPFAASAGYGDDVHPNNYGNQIIARNMLANLNGGKVTIESITQDLGGNGLDGFRIEEGCTNSSLRAYINNGKLYVGGAVYERTGYGAIARLPFCSTPAGTRYLPCFYYADADHQGMGRVYIKGTTYTDGTQGNITWDRAPDVNIVGSGASAYPTTTYSENLKYRIYIPPMELPIITGGW